jgi:hypothetical protein
MITVIGSVPGGDDGQGQQHEGKVSMTLMTVMIVQAVCPPKYPPGQSQQNADGRGDQHRRDPDDEGNPRTVDDTGQGSRPTWFGTQQLVRAPPAIHAGGAKRYRMFTARGSCGATHGASAAMTPMTNMATDAPAPLELPHGAQRSPRRPQVDGCPRRRVLERQFRAVHPPRGQPGSRRGGGNDETARPAKVK